MVPKCKNGNLFGNITKTRDIVSLVLNLETAMVTPYFHVQHDNLFEMVCPTPDNMPTVYQWQHLYVFFNNMRHRNSKKQPISDPDPVILEQEKK